MASDLGHSSTMLLFVSRFISALATVKFETKCEVSEFWGTARCPVPSNFGAKAFLGQKCKVVRWLLHFLNAEIPCADNTAFDCVAASGLAVKALRCGGANHAGQQYFQGEKRDFVA